MGASVHKNRHSSSCAYVQSSIIVMQLQNNVLHCKDFSQWYRAVHRSIIFANYIAAEIIGFYMHQAYSSILFAFTYAKSASLLCTVLWKFICYVFWSHNET